MKSQSRIALLACSAGFLVSAIETPRVVAHRGNYQYDDNALGGFRQSLEAGVTGFETDVQMTSDGGFVIMHNNTVDATTSGTGDVKDMTFDAVTSLTLKKSGEHVPSLAQLAELFRGRNDIFVEFEMKSQGFSGQTLSNYVDGVYAIVSSAMAAGTYTFTSFSQDYVRAMKSNHPDVSTALITGTTYATADDLSFITTAKNLGCSQVSPAVGTCKEWIDAAKAEGLRVALWMCEDISTWTTCRAKGADTVTSNNPITLYAAATNYMHALEVQGVGWSGQRYFTNDIPWRIDSVLEGSEGLGKWGAGEVIYSGKSSFTGDVLLAGGENLLTTPGNDVVNTQVGSLGNPRAARTVVVSNAVLRMVGQNSFGGSGRSTTPVRTDLKFYNSTLDLTTNFAFNAGDVYLHNSQVKFHGGLSHWGKCDKVSGPNDSAFWGALFANNLYFSGNRAIEFRNETTNLSNDQYRKAGVSVGKFAPDGTVKLSQQGVIDVPDMTGNADSDVIFHVPLVWTTGDNAPCSGFRKTGAGTLELGTLDDNNTAKWSNYTGDVDVVEGTLKMNANYASIADDRPSVFGAARYAHTVTVHPGATLNFAANDLMGQFFAMNKITLHVKGGRLQTNNGIVNGIGRTIFDSADISIGNAPGSFTYWYKPAAPTAVTNKYVGSWPSIGFNQGVTFTGTNAYNLSNGNATYHFGADFGATPTELRLDDITKDAAVDLTIAGRLVDAPTWYDATWPEDEYKRRYVGNLRHAGQPLNLRKTGAGTLLLNNVNSATTGRIDIAEGVVQVKARGNSDQPAPTSALGDLTAPGRTIVISGGTLQMLASDTFGQAACVNTCTFAVTNGTIRQDGEWANALPYLDLYDANFVYNGGLGTGNFNAPYGTFIFARKVRWDGTRPYDLQPRGNNCVFALGHELDEYREIDGAITNLHGKVEFEVADITRDANPDVTIGVTLKSQATWGGDHNYVWGTTRFHNGLVKSGSGTLRLNGTGRIQNRNANDNYYYKEATRITGGTLLVDSTAFASTNVFVEAGAFLGGTGTVARATIESNGGFTAAPGQMRALNARAIDLPSDGTAGLDIPFLGDWDDLKALRVPVVTGAANLASVKWNVTVNGAPPPKGFSANAVLSNGIVYGVIARTGFTFIVR